MGNVRIADAQRRHLRRIAYAGARMQPSDRQRPVMLRLVATTGPAGFDRKRPPRPTNIRLVVDDRPRLQLLNTMTLVAAARRHAAGRIRDKLRVARGVAVGLVASIATIDLVHGILADKVNPLTHRNLAIMSLLAVISLLLLYRRSAEERAVLAVRDLEDCVDTIDALACELRRGRLCDADLVHDVRRRYAAALRRCRCAHKHSDYLAARAALADSGRQTWRAGMRYAADVALREIALGVAPLLFLAAI